MFAKDLTGCFSHCCVEDSDHSIYVCIFVAHDGERRKLPAYHSFEGFQHVGIFSFSRSLKKGSWSRQHPSRTGPSRWRGCNHRCNDNLQQDLADRRIANPMDPVLSHHTSQERQPAAVPELPNNQPHQSPKQSHAEDHTIPKKPSPKALID